jgi:genome maintenance exonuclease 1
MISSFREKYNYPVYHVNKINNIRFYSVSENLNVPSVTSILRLTNPKQPINFNLNYKTDSMEIGNYMHKYLEHYVSRDDSFHSDTKNYVIAKKLAQIIIDNFIDNLDEAWGTEVSVLYKNLYAGTIDLIGKKDERLSVIDYKSSYRKKTKEEMEEYFLQLAAYAIAHDWQYKTNIDSLIVFLAIRNGEFEKTVISGQELDSYKEKWFERLDVFSKLTENIYA